MEKGESIIDDSDTADFVRHAVYLLEGGFDDLRDKAESLGIVTQMHGTPSVSAMLRLVHTGHLRIVRSGKFYAISGEDTRYLGIQKSVLLSKRRRSRTRNELE